MLGNRELDKSPVIIASAKSFPGPRAGTLLFVPWTHAGRAVRAATLLQPSSTESELFAPRKDRHWCIGMRVFITIEKARASAYVCVVYQVCPRAHFPFIVDPWTHVIACHAIPSAEQRVETNVRDRIDSATKMTEMKWTRGIIIFYDSY
jgi:hypothetical protein